MVESALTGINTLVQNLIPAARAMRIEITDLGPGHASARVPLEGNTNHLGTLYAGSLFSVAEILGGAICFPTFDISRFLPMVKTVEIQFRRPATTDVTATATLTQEVIDRVTAEAEDAGKAEFILEAEVTDTDGQVVVTTVGTYQLRRIAIAE